MPDCIQQNTKSLHHRKNLSIISVFAALLSLKLSAIFYSKASIGKAFMIIELVNMGNGVTRLPINTVFVKYYAVLDISRLK